MDACSNTGKRRVVITGVGVLCPLAHDKEEYWDCLVAGRSGTGPITLFDASAYTSRVGGEVKGFDPEQWLDKRLARRLDRFAQLGLVAARQAVADSGLDFARIDCDSAGVYMGTGIGGLSEMEEQHTRLLERGPSRVSPFLVPKLMGNACAGQISIEFGLRGPNAAVVTACASASHAIATAFKLVQDDKATIMLTGGSEAALTRLGLAGFCTMKALSTRNDEPERASRPFDKDRDGFVIGEGAGVLVLEELEHARGRSARMYAEVLGCGMSGDGFHITQPDPEGRGPCLAMRRALQDARCHPEDIGYINAHGTSTVYNDAAETRAIKTVFRDYARRVPISSTKSMLGHLLGASGGVELIACALAVERGVLHPTINYETPDPDCDLDYIPNEARDIRPARVMSNSFGFGGHNAAIIIGALP